MGIIYLFDVDGTLTDAKQKMDSNFANQFLKWMRGKEVYIVSGGSFVRILNQLGMEILDLCSGVFACMGNICPCPCPFIANHGSEKQKTKENQKMAINK